MADLDVHDCTGLAMPFDLENDSCWAKGNVGAKAGNMRQPRNSENYVFIRGPKINYTPGHALSATFRESQSEVRDEFDNFLPCG